jgi:hypothetical protein
MEQISTTTRGTQMTEYIEKPTTSISGNEQPILQLHRVNYVKIAGKILDTTDAKLSKYLQFASQQMNTEITAGDVIEHALKMLFDRDAGFKNWLKRN